MIKIIIQKFIKDYENVSDRNVRTSYVVLSGTVGIICNLFLSIIKLTIGFLVNSISVMSDGFNNFTDLGASLAAIIGGKLSNQPPDEEHPYGHGRWEYIGSLVVAAMIFVVGFKLLSASYDKLINPEPVTVSVITFIILILSVAVKLWMFSYNMYIANKVNSSINRAVAIDSRNDVLATGMVIVAMIMVNFTDLPVDAVGGMCISLFILYGGYGIVKDTVSLLLGSGPDPEVVESINQLVCSGKYVIGTHDLAVHDYGPSRAMASIHAEVPDDVNIAEVHSSIDTLENQIKEELGINIVIHIDPISTDIEKIQKATDLDQKLPGRTG